MEHLRRRSIQLLLMLLITACGQQSEDVSDTEGTLKTLRVGTFNMLRLGHGTKDDDRLVNLIVESKFHVFSGTEIMRADAAHDLRDKLRAKTGKKWELSLSEHASGETSYKEFLGFYYRSDLVNPVTSAEGFCASNDANAQTENGCFANDVGTDDGPSFDRDPYIAQFKVGARRLAIAAVHLVWGGSDAEAKERRMGELFELKKVLEKVSLASQGYEVIAAGDFNLTLNLDVANGTKQDSNSTEMPGSFFLEAPAVTGLISEPTTVGLSNYDHVVYLNSNNAKHVPDSEKVVIDFDLGDAEAKALFKKDVSDHFPAGVSFSL